jgi:pimeloyl-ACP methyl ester carboxylesterase
MTKNDVSMGTGKANADYRAHSVRANGIDIHYIEAGVGEPLIVLNNGMISTHPIWADWHNSYAPFMGQFAEHFRVIAPDCRGSGRTVHSGGPITHNLLADDVVALIDALDLQKPLICGYGDGAQVATIVGIRKPGSVRAIVNHGGLVHFNTDPILPYFVWTRQMLGGRPDATQADPDAVAKTEFLRPMVERMKADHDVAQGAGHWKTVLKQTFDRVRQPSGYTFEDLRAITAPTLILVGDRDRHCTVEEGVTAYRALKDGELAVLPNTPAMNAGGWLDSGTAVKTTIEFFERRLGTRT